MLFLDLPRDVLEELVSYFPFDEISVIALVCRTLHDVCRSSHLWQILYRNHFQESPPPIGHAEQSFRDRFTRPARLRRLSTQATFTYNHSHAVSSLRLCGNTLVSSSLDKTVKMINLNTRAVMSVLLPTRDRV
jgi:hypothetical protein